MSKHSYFDQKMFTAIMDNPLTKRLGIDVASVPLVM
jgi:hypothetical protein